MGRLARTRVELNNLPSNASYDEREIAFKKMFATFKKSCIDCGILHNFKEHETFESKSRKKRRKQRESEIARLKSKIRENFLQGKTNG